MLGNLLVGLQRHHRGEQLAAMRMVQVYALDRVLELIDLLDLRPADPPAADRDPFNADRRFEFRHPEEVAGLRRWAAGIERTPNAALALLERLEALAEVPAAVAARIRALAG